jgi:hypothetical protein
MKTIDLMRGLVNHPPDGTQTDDDGLDALWRPSADFVGPVEPPMVRWLRMGSPPSPWQIAARARHAAAPCEQLSFRFEDAASTLNSRRSQPLFDGKAA